jgi:hypothetical protein
MTCCKESHSVEIKWGKRFAVVSFRGDEMTANFMAVCDTDTIASKTDFDAGLKELCDDRREAAQAQYE